MSEFPVCESHATGLSRVTCALRLPRALRLPSCLSAQRKNVMPFLQAISLCMYRMIYFIR